ncbi:STAS domain-containing protein [Polaromonas sp.]|jgi:phospholipid transport system transporter-binding protein|uniref:STAS domain-containing protein n=1 Tax=Polaromonas sp. TaxID=1869339 RepID=UPI001A2FBDB0|nr:STAS domain-containing protein [Burkholderiales bacterium]MBH2020565.1 STAS domain-containing protein [Burkholderiales bacterium]
MLKLPAVLTHAVACEFFRTLEKEVPSLPGKEVVVDARALSQFDSSALAILLQCRRQALTAGKVFSVQGAPPRLLQLAEVYGVSALIPATPERSAAVAA